MATNTYVAIQTQTLTSSATSVTFSSIPQTYTDLIIVSSQFYTSTGGDRLATFQVGNGSVDTGSNYSWTYMDTYPGSPSSGRGSDTGYGLHSYTSSIPVTTPMTCIMQIQSYSNTTINKTMLHRFNASPASTGCYVSLWRSTAAINIITITAGGANFATGTTFTLYGVANSNIGAPKAFGGTITQDATHTYHTFGASGTFTPQQSLTCDYLVVAGGGGASAFGSGGGTGGGGAGGLRSSIVATGGGGSLESAINVTAQNYTITVGAGGAFVNNANGNNGTDSTFSTITSTGGGRGAYDGNGGNGGSGGGGYGYPAGSFTGGTRVTGQGFAGGVGSTDGSTWTASAGGGGAGAVGATTTSDGNGGAGGIGVSIPIVANVTGTGVETYYGGGGGGGTTRPAWSGGAGGLGGGGRGGSQGQAGINAIANTGGGGGGAGGASSTVAGNGGSGVVIIRYAN
jgi:hypothetical protein